MTRPATAASPWRSVSGASLDVATTNQILLTEVGSTVHGIALPGRDDTDQMGIWVEPPSMALGVRDDQTHVTARTKPDGVRSEPGDVDLTLYTLRRFLRLASRGNPTVLLPLWAPAAAVIVSTRWGSTVRDQRMRFVTKETGRRFLGYLEQQRQMVADPGMSNRTDLVDAHGFDVKAAAHAYRLGTQGRRLLMEGRIDLPMSDPERETALAIKRGEVSLPDALDLIDTERRMLRAEIAVSRWPDRADVGWLSSWSARLHLNYWRSKYAREGS